MSSRYANQLHPELELRLFCFHHAGGSAAAFNSWSAAFPPGIRVERVSLPGRNPDGPERPHRRTSTLLPWLYAKLAPLLDRPFAIYGQSLGSVVAFEFARAIRANGGRTPLALFVSSRRAPQCPLTRSPLCALPDRELVSRLRSLGGVPDALADSAKWMRHFLPVLRADLEASDLYEYRPGPPLTCPIVAFRGIADPIVSDAEIRAWAAQASGAFTAVTLPGRHFFSPEGAAQLRQVIIEHLMSLAKAPLQTRQPDFPREQDTGPRTRRDAAEGISDTAPLNIADRFPG